MTLVMLVLVLVLCCCAVRVMKLTGSHQLCNVLFYEMYQDHTNCAIFLQKGWLANFDAIPAKSKRGCTMSTLSRFIRNTSFPAPFKYLQSAKWKTNVKKKVKTALSYTWLEFVSECLKLSPTRFADLTDVTLADEDSNSIPNLEPIQVTPPSYLISVRNMI